LEKKNGANLAFKLVQKKFFLIVGRKESVGKPVKNMNGKEYS